MRSNRVAKWWYCLIAIAIAIAVASCADDNGSFSIPFFPTMPINGVVVYTPLYSIVEVGDTVTITSAGFHNGNGLGVEPIRTAIFNVSDTTTVRLEPRSMLYPNTPAVLARGRQEGVVVITATLNGVAGTDSLRVIPAIGRIEIITSHSTIHVGDTVTVDVRIIATDGTVITTPQWPVIQAEPIGLLIGAPNRNKMRGTSPGTATVTVKVGRATGTATVSILPQ